MSAGNAFSCSQTGTVAAGEGERRSVLVEYGPPHERGAPELVRTGASGFTSGSCPHGPAPPSAAEAADRQLRPASQTGQECRVAQHLLDHVCQGLAGQPIGFCLHRTVLVALDAATPSYSFVQPADDTTTLTVNWIWSLVSPNVISGTARLSTTRSIAPHPRSAHGKLPGQGFDQLL